MEARNSLRRCLFRNTAPIFLFCVPCFAIVFFVPYWWLLVPVLSRRPSEVSVRSVPVQPGWNTPWMYCYWLAAVAFSLLIVLTVQTCRRYRPRTSAEQVASGEFFVSWTRRRPGVKSPTSDSLGVPPPTSLLPHPRLSVAVARQSQDAAWAAQPRLQSADSMIAHPSSRTLSNRSDSIDTPQSSCTVDTVVDCRVSNVFSFSPEDVFFVEASSCQPPAQASGH